MRYQRFRAHHLAACAAVVLFSLTANAQQPNATASIQDQATILVGWTGFVINPPECSNVALSVSVNGQQYASVGTYTGNFATVSDLSAGTYTFRVSGCTFAPPGLGSAVTPAVTLAGLGPPPEPTGIEIVPGNAPGDFIVRWDIVVGADRYEIRERYYNGANWTAFGDWISTGTNRAFSKEDQVPGSYQFEVRACSTAQCSDPVTSPTWFVESPSIDGGAEYYLEDLRVRAIWTADEGCYVLFRDLPSACETQFSNAHALISVTDPNHEKLYSQAFMSAAVGKSLTVWFDDNGNCGSADTLMNITQLEITD